MSRRVLGLLLWSWGVGSGFLAGSTVPEDAEPGLELVDLAPGVFAAIQPEATRYLDCNSLVLIGPDEVVVVDPPSFPRANEQLAAVIRDRAPDADLTLVATHWHGDHSEGVDALRARLGRRTEVIGHESLVVDIVERAARDHRATRERYEELLPGARRQLEQGTASDGSPLTDEDRESLKRGIERVEQWLRERGDAQFLTPGTAYREKLTVRRAGHRIELFHLVGHTRGDTAVYLPDLGVLAAGDLVDELPFAGHGYPRRWIASLDRLDQLEIRHIVPGHGSVTGGPEPLRTVRGFLDDLVGQVEAGRARGLTVDETRSSLDLSAWRSRMADDDRKRRNFDANLETAFERVWADLSGELETGAPAGTP